MENDTTQQLLTEVKAKDNSQPTVITAEDVQHEIKSNEAVNDEVTSNVHLCAGMAWDAVYVMINLEGPVERANHRHYLYLL